MKKVVGTVLTILSMLLTCGQAQQSALITNIEGRHTIDLNGRWQTIIDPYETGYYDYRYQPSNNGYFKNAKPKVRPKKEVVDLSVPFVILIRPHSALEQPVTFLYRGSGQNQDRGQTSATN